LYDITEENGHTILEYQPWKSYVNNKSVNERAKKNFKSILIRPEDFERILKEIGFVIVERMGTPLCESKGFSRPILVMHKPGLREVGDASSAVTSSADNKEPLLNISSSLEYGTAKIDDVNDFRAIDAKIQRKRKRKEKRKKQKSTHNNDDDDNESEVYEKEMQHIERQTA